MRRSRTPLRGQGTLFAAQFSAGYTTNISGFDLRQAQGSLAAKVGSATRTATKLPESLLPVVIGLGALLLRLHVL